MRFIIGLALGCAVGFAAYVLITPQRRRDGEAAGQESPEATAPDDHDPAAAVRRAMRSLQAQVQEAWTEAQEAAKEADKEIRANYQRMAHRTAENEE